MRCVGTFCIALAGMGQASVRREPDDGTFTPACATGYRPSSNPWFGLLEIIGYDRWYVENHVMTIALSAPLKPAAPAWPSAAQYNEAIQNLRTCVADAELRHGEPALSPLGLPMPYSGGFADVYKVHCPATGNTWAVKCFTKSVSGLHDRYTEISRWLDAHRLPFMIDFQYLDQGIRISGSWYPIVKMPWIEGQNLNRFVAQWLDQPRMLDQLFSLWVRLAARLRDARIAHADLQHGNVVLVPHDAEGRLSLKLIDYDGMYVPGLANYPTREVGHRNYQHPQRVAENLYNADVDRFSNLAICCAIRCARVGGRPLWEEFDLGENLLFSEHDFLHPSDSPLFRELWTLRNAQCRALVGHLVLATQLPVDQVPLIEELVKNGEVRPLTADERNRVQSLLGNDSHLAMPPPELLPVDAKLEPIEDNVVPPPVQSLNQSSTHSAWRGGGMGHQAVDALIDELLRGQPADEDSPQSWDSHVSRRASYCGECFTALDHPATVQAMPVTVDAEGNLRSQLVSVLRSKSANRIHTRIAMRDGMWHGPQPPKHLPRSTVVVVAVVLIALAVGEAALLSAKGFVLTALLVALGGTVTSGAAIYFYRPRLESPLSVVWEYVIPRMLRQPMSHDFFAFLVGLARLSEPLPDRMRQHVVEDAAATCLAVYQERNLAYPYVAALYRLLLIDLIRNNSTRAAATALISNLLYRWRDRQLPTEALDGITASGALLNRLSPSQQRLLTWRFIYESAKSGVTLADLTSMAAASGTLNHLLTKPERLSNETLALAFAVAQLDPDQLTQFKCLSLFDVASRNDPAHFVDGKNLPLMWSTNEFQLTTDGLYFRQTRLTSQSTTTISTLVEFVRTGWKHQRIDGGRDRRFKNNFPVGYNRIAGYVLYVEDREFRYVHDPNLIANRIQAWRELYFGCLKPNSLAFLNSTRTNWRSRYCPAEDVRCLRCGTLQQYREGQIAMRLAVDGGNW